MTWDQIISFIIIALLLCLYFRADYQRWDLKRQLNRAKANELTALHIANDKSNELTELRRSLAHPSFAGYKPTDKTIESMHTCVNCHGLRHITHFMLYPTHVKL